MSDTASKGPFARAANGDDRNLAFVVYALFFVSPFLFAFTAIVGVVIAYIRRSEAPPLERTHYNFQVRIFWIGLLLTAIAAVAGALAIAFGIGDLYRLATRGDGSFDAWDAAAWTANSFDVGELTIHPMTILSVLVMLLTAVIGSLWMMIVSIFGLARLAGTKPIGRLPLQP